MVLGATGTGKTKASIELAAEVLGGLGFGCEIVNCDALQCYEGSPVSTNKASEEEMAGVPHRLIGFAPADKDFTAGDFRVRAREALESTWRRGKLPILCGGLFCEASSAGSATPPKSSSKATRALLLPHPRTWRTRTDAAEGETTTRGCGGWTPRWRRVHPNNERRVRRYLEIFQQTGASQRAVREARRGLAKAAL